jgi:hypothetical protein
MNGKDDKAKKDDSATRPQSSTNVSTKLREEKKGQQTRGEEKKERPLPTDATKKEDTISNQSVKTKVMTDLPSPSDTSGAAAESQDLIVQKQQYAIF